MNFRIPSGCYYVYPVCSCSNTHSGWALQGLTAVLKRFMTWLLHQFQRVLGALTGKRNQSPVSQSTQLGDEVALRLQSSRDRADGDAPVAVRTQSAQLGVVLPPQSTAPLRQKNSSVLKDAVDPVAAQPDTHQRLDAAPAALPGGTLAAPRFPTDVSELISSQSSQLPVLKDDDSDSLPMTPVEPPSQPELPDIHDLLPAVEPDEPESNRTAETQVAVDENAYLSTPSDLDRDSTSSSPHLDAPVIESAQRVSVPDQATLFSFDIVEADTSPESESQQASEAAPAPVPIVESLIPDTLLDDLALDDPALGSSAAQEPATEKASTQEISESESSATHNPWLTAVPSTAQKVEDTTSTEDKTSTDKATVEPLVKNGVVKLLFKLKQGNFHGYIAPEDGSKDILFHQKYINADIFEHLERGTPVVATMKYMEGKAYATRVDLSQE